MFELIAKGPHPRQRWKQTLWKEDGAILGRHPETDLPVPWDPCISRRHVCLTPSKKGVRVEKLSESANPLFFNGEEVEHCEVQSGEHFVLGSTLFEIVSSPEEWSSPRDLPVEEVTFNRQELRNVRFRDADKRIEVLSHLPEVIWGARTESDLYHRLVNLLLAGVVHSEAVAVVRYGAENQVEVLHWDRRQETAGEFRPSSRLVEEAVRKRRESVLHVWESKDRAKDDYTATAEFDWAYCTPVAESAAEDWGLYVAGRLDRGFLEEGTVRTHHFQLQGDVKFTELVAEIISSVRRLNRLERQQAGLRQFFAPPVLSALGLSAGDQELNTDLLEPRECEVAVLFCDLRGFSQKAQEAADNLTGLLERVSRALGVMTQNILNYGGVTGDFQGDSALGFWGWPFRSEDAPLDACRAALEIQSAFMEIRREKDHPLADFEMGIGIAYGRAVAGKIGTSDQVKVTVFGPVVNLASRLEGMTKQLRVPILLDESTAEIVRDRLGREEGRTRRLARILPYGMETPVVVSELLPPEGKNSELTDAHIVQYERGVDHFLAGEWDEAYRCIHEMPSSDRAQDFLAMLIAQHNRVAPPDWDGIVRLPNK